MRKFQNEFFAKNFLEKKPFAFRYNGEETAAAFPPLAEVVSEKAGENGQADRVRYESVWQSSEGNLRAVLIAEQYKESGVTEWWLEMENAGECDSYLVTDLHYCEIEAAPATAPASGHWEWPALCSCKGSQAAKDDFRMERLQFATDPNRVFTCGSGRASSEYMPYFNVQLSARSGLILAIGWSGTWKSHFRVKSGDPMRSVLATVQFPDACFRLYPGEKITLPSMLALPWYFPEIGTPAEDAFRHFEETDCDGADIALDESFNAFRRFIYQNMIPKIHGKPVEGKIAMRAWGSISMEAHTRKIGNIKKFKMAGEYYAIDAGWYGNNWFPDVGDWEPLPGSYPNGLKGLADEAAEAGLRFSAWMEWERAGVSAKNIREHRDFYLGHTFPKDGYRATPAPNGTYNMWFGLLVNFGYEPARVWIRDTAASLIRDAHMDLFRLDFNLDPADCWHYHDAPDRKGITEIKYINGLYRTFDELLAMFPGLMFDNCASGGRRLDYAFGKRAIPVMCRSDYFTGKDYKPEGVQAHTYALSRWLPVHGDSAGSCTGQSTLSLDTYKFRSSICSGIGVPAPEWELTEEEGAWYRKMIEEAIRVRPYTCKDFYPLTGYSLSRKDWLAFRFHDYDTGNGVIMAFRREESAGQTFSFLLDAGIDPDAVYEIEDIDEGVVSRGVKGADLAAEGLAVTIPERRMARIIFYSKR